MFHRKLKIEFRQGNAVRELFTAITQLKRERGNEKMYTADGDCIDMNDVISINGVYFQ